MQQAFREVPKFNIDQYLEFNSQISSEMFVSVMSILQERLPCSAFYFRQRRMFKHDMLLKQEDGMAVDRSNGTFDTHSRGSYGTRRSARGTGMNGSAGPEMGAACITAIAEPRILNAWSPVKRGSQKRLSNISTGSFREMRIDASPDFRITRGTGVQSDANKRLATMNCQRDSADRISRAQYSSSVKNG